MKITSNIVQYTLCSLVHALVLKLGNYYLRWDENFYSTLNVAELSLLKWPFLCTIECLLLKCMLFLTSISNSLWFQYFQITLKTSIIICIHFKVGKCFHIHLFICAKPEKLGDLLLPNYDESCVSQGEE